MIWLILSLLLNGPVIRNVGYCPDVTSAECSVREYYPRNLRMTAAGQDVYYFVSDERPARVAFVSRDTYSKYGIGQMAPEGLIWRDHLP